MPDRESKNPKNLHKEKNKSTMDRLEEKLPKNNEGVDIRRYIPPEQKYVRRTTEEFKAGAEPVRDGGSHRLKQVALTVSPELHTVVKEQASAEGVSFIFWVRAATRKALREGIDVKKELETPVEIPAKVSKEPKI